MRKLVTAVAMVATLVMGVAAPALALHFGTVVTNHSRASDPDHVRSIAIQLNRSDVRRERIEALLDLYTGPYDEERVKVEVDWVALRTCPVNDKYNAGCQNALIEYSGWVCPGADLGLTYYAHCESTPHANYISTDWLNVCQTRAYDGWYFFALARYRIMWDDIGGDPIGQWFSKWSNSYQMSC